MSRRVKLPLVALSCIIDRYHTDPSGTFVRYEAKAIGSGSEAAQTELQDKWHKVRRIDLYDLFRVNPHWLPTANVTQRSPNIDFACTQAGNGGEVGSSQRSVGSGGLSILSNPPFAYEGPQVTTTKGFEILDETQLKDVIDVM